MDREIGLRRIIWVCGLLCGLSILWAVSGEAQEEQTYFTDVTEEAFNVRLPGARSTAFGDYDNDGWPDLLCSDGGETGRIVLLYNEGDGTFTDRATDVLPDISREDKGGGAIFGDYDNDGDLDLFVPVGSFGSPGRNILLRNDRGVFRDVTLAAGLTDSLSTGNAIWLDYGKDGYIDLYVGNGGGPEARNTLHRNNGDGTFTDVTEEVGLDVPLSAGGGGSNGGMAAGDYNDDGWPDLYVGVFRAPNRLFLNDGGGGFRDVTTDEIGNEGEAFGVAVGDVNNDGHLDVFQAAGGGVQTNLPYASLMLMNLGEGVFTDALLGVGLSDLDGTQTLNAGLADIDNDGDLDLLIINPISLYINNGDGTFADKASHLGIEAGYLAGSFGDYDLDGFLDVVMTLLI